MTLGKQAYPQSTQAPCIGLPKFTKIDEIFNSLNDLHYQSHMVLTRSITIADAMLGAYPCEGLPGSIKPMPVSVFDQILEKIEGIKEILKSIENTQNRYEGIINL